MDGIRTFANEVITNVEKVIIGQREAIEILLTALLCEEYCSSRMCRAQARLSLAARWLSRWGSRSSAAWCTPDLLPNDVTGVSVYSQQTSQFEFIPQSGLCQHPPRR